jgi:hypothetical protein
VLWSNGRLHGNLRLRGRDGTYVSGSSKIGAGKIVTFERERQVVVFGECVGRAVAGIEGGTMAASAIAQESRPRLRRELRILRHHLISGA